MDYSSMGEAAGEAILEPITDFISGVSSGLAGNDQFGQIVTAIVGVLAIGVVLWGIWAGLKVLRKGIGRTAS